MRMQAAIAAGVAAVMLAGGTARAVQQLAPGVTMQQKNAIAEAGNRFALELYDRLEAQEGNIFFSPYSIATALTMTYAGARGDTAAQMARVLHLPAEEAQLHRAVAALKDEIERAGAAEGCELSIANALWGQKGFDFLAAFLNILDDNYGARLRELDFVNNAEAARRTINDWVDEQTNGKIKDIMAPGVLGALTRLVLTNAIYFKGDWTRPFKKELTRDEPFWTSAEHSADAPMMHQTDDFQYGESDQCQAVLLPYAKGRLAMLVLLPRERDGLARLADGMEAEDVGQWLSRLRRREVELSLPRFKLTSQFSLGDTLRQMGMADAFALPPADFSGMDGQKDLYISAVIHKAFVDVNEEGTEAAAATAVAMELGAAVPPQPPVVFRADHPFLFFIVERRSGSILFMGRLSNPCE